MLIGAICSRTPLPDTPMKLLKPDQAGNGSYHHANNITTNGGGGGLKSQRCGKVEAHVMWRTGTKARGPWAGDSAEHENTPAATLYRIADFTIGPESSLWTERQKHRLNRAQKARCMRS